MEQQAFEGTWEELLTHEAEFKGKRVKLMLVTEEPGGNGHKQETSHFYDTATPEEWEAVMDALAQGGEDLPILPPEAYDRENLYEDRL